MTNQKLYKDLIAVALEYKTSDKAPYITAKGKGELANKIIEIAKTHKVDIKKDATLAHILNTLEINDYIPLEAFGAVSAILAEIYNYSKTT